MKRIIIYVLGLYLLIKILPKAQEKTASKLPKKKINKKDMCDYDNNATYTDAILK